MKTNILKTLVSAALVTSMLLTGCGSASDGNTTASTQQAQAAAGSVAASESEENSGKTVIEYWHSNADTQ